MQLRCEAVEVLVTVKGCRIGMRRMPSILLKGMEQRPIDNVLRFPEHHRKRSRSLIIFSAEERSDGSAAKFVASLSIRLRMRYSSVVASRAILVAAASRR